MRLTALLFLMIGSSLFGCSSSSPDVVQRPDNSRVGASNTAAVQNAQPETAALNPASNPAVNTSAENTLENPNKRKVVNGPGDGRPVLNYEPAAEDSQIAQTMNNSGQMFEIRIWKKNPQLLRVESLWVDQKNKALTIMLRSGKVLNVTTDRIPNLKLATASQLLEIAGVQPAAAPSTKAGPKKAQ